MDWSLEPGDMCTQHVSLELPPKEMEFVEASFDYQYNNYLVAHF